MRSLGSIENFGAIDADNDDLLLESFEDHEAFQRALARSRFLLVGRKGSGKTAIFKKMLTISRPDYFCFGHTFSDYPWHHHNLQARVGIPDYDRFTHSWKYLIFLTTAKIVLNHDQSLPHSDTAMDAMARVERFVIDTYGTRDPDVTQIFTPTKRLKLKPHFELDWKILKAGVAPESVPMEELPTIVQELNANLLTYIMATLNPEHEYFICFDQLDLGFDPTNKDYADRLIGLLLAARDINIAARNAWKKFFVVVFLRDDIYDNLHFEDKNKITENFISLIEWDTPRTDKTLKQLMEKRFAVLLADSKSEQARWESVFNEQQEMPGHQTKYQHILDRTYLRPRDMIRFCNSTLKAFKVRVQLPAPGQIFENTDVHEARPDYSHYFVNELDDEIHKHVPRYREYLEVLRGLGTWQFDKAAFSGQFNATVEAGDGEVAIDTALRQLYEFSVIGFYRPGGRGYGGSEYVFRYKEPRTKYDPAAVRFRVHPGLIDVLGLKRF